VILWKDDIASFIEAVPKYSKSEIRDALISMGEELRFCNSDDITDTDLLLKLDQAFGSVYRKVNKDSSLKNEAILNLMEDLKADIMHLRQLQKRGKTNKKFFRHAIDWSKKVLKLANYMSSSAGTIIIISKIAENYLGPP